MGTAPASGTAAPTVVEVLRLSAHAGTLRYRLQRQSMRGGDHPDDVARRLAGLSLCTPGALLHSTSWRFCDGAIVLTYAALPDLEGGPGLEVAAARLVSAGSPLTPSPAQVDDAAVAAHACRHLALLLTTDQAVADAARALPQVWDLIRALQPACAGSPRPPILTGTP